jgi:hypothetical protein
MSTRRRWQVTRYIAALFDPDDAEWSGLPFLDISTADTGAHTFDNIVGWAGARKCLLDNADSVTAHNSSYISFILATNLVLCLYELVKCFTNQGQFTFDLLMVVVLFDTCFLSSYFIAIFEKVAGANAHQRQHLAALQNAKFALMKQCWQRRDGEGRRWHSLRHDRGLLSTIAIAQAHDVHSLASEGQGKGKGNDNLAMSNGGAIRGDNECEAKNQSNTETSLFCKVAEATRLCQLLDSLVEYLNTNDSLCRVFGMPVDDAYRVKLLVVLLAGMAAPIVEGLIQS